MRPEEAAENLELIAEVYRRAATDAITAAELEQAKSKVRSRIVLSSERPRGRMFAVGSDWIYRRQYRPVEQDLAEIAAISVDDVAAVLRKYPLERNMTISVGPAEGDSGSARPMGEG